MLKKPKGPPFTLFGTMRLLKILIFRFFLENLKIFRNFSMSPKGRSFIFLIFCNKLDFQNAQRAPLLQFKKKLRFLSLGYGADFRRSRLVFPSGFPRYTSKCTTFGTLYSNYTCCGASDQAMSGLKLIS